MFSEGRRAALGGGPGEQAAATEDDLHHEDARPCRQLEPGIRTGQASRTHCPVVLSVQQWNAPN